MLNQSLVGRRRGGGFIGEMIRWFIQIAIYQICIGTIAAIFGVSHFVATFIFLGILLVIAGAGYIIKQKSSPSVDGPYNRY